MWQLIFYKVYAELRIEIARGYLGIFWWILEPILYMLAFYIIFGVVMQRGSEGYVLTLLTGLVTWKWFDATLRSGANSISANHGLMQQVYVPKYIFPSIVILTNLVKFIIVILLFLTFLLLYGVQVQLTWIVLPIIIFVQLLFIFAVTYFISAIVPFIPDLNIIINNALILLMFMSGIFFKIQELPQEIQFWFYLNPMAVLIEAYRQILLDGHWPEWEGIGIVVLVSVVGILAATKLLKHFDRIYPKVIW